MKFIRLFLSLHSIQLIVISALLMTYLAVTAVNRPNKTEAIQEIPSAEGEGAADTPAAFLSRGKNIKAIVSQPTAEIIFEARIGLETAPVIEQVIPVSNAVIVAEGSRENEGGPAADPLVLDRRAVMLDR